MRALAMAALLLAQGPGTPRLAGGVVTGEIRTAEGAPAAGVRVSALAATDVFNTPAAAPSAMMGSLAQTDALGRYRLEDVPAGRYYIMAGLIEFPSFFPGVKTLAEARVVTLAAGAAVSGISFTLARPAGVRVSGRVRGIPAGAPAGFFRATLLPSGADAPVQSDGTFEFLKLSPGRYGVRLMPAVAPAATVTIQVDDQDISVDMTMGPALIGRVVVDDGSKLPVQMGAIAAGTPDPLALVQVRARRVAPAAAVPTAPTANTNLGGNRGAAPAQVSAVVRSDGFFFFPASAGEYQIWATVLPFGYYVRSAEMDPNATLIRVTLTTTPPSSEPPGVKVSGRVTGLAAGTGARWVSMTQNSTSPGPVGLTEQRVGEAPIRDNGTFEILRVPPGTANVRVLSSPGAGPAPTPLQMQVDIADRDVSIEFSVSSSGPAVAGPRIPTPSPFTIIVPDPPPLPPPPAVPTTVAPPIPPPAPADVGVLVSGRITGAPVNSAGLSPRITLIQSGRGLFQEQISRDGRFVFPKVPPGTYTVRLSLVGEYTLFDALVVRDKDLIGVEITAPGP